MNRHHNRQSATRSWLHALPVALLTIAAVALSSSGAKPGWADAARARKADYYFLEAKNRELADELDAAYELFNEAHSLNRADETAGLELSQYLLALASNDSAAIEYAVSLMADYYNAHPDDYQTALVYGQINRNLGRYEINIETLERSHALYPADPRITLSLAYSLAASDDSLRLRRAVSLMDTLMLNEGVSDEFMMDKIQMLYILRDSVAIDSATLALVSKPELRNATNLMLVGRIFSGLGDPERALPYFNEACRADSTSGQAFYYLASCYRAMGDSVACDREIYEAIRRKSLEPEVKNGIITEYISSHLDDSLMRGRIEELFRVLLDQHPLEPEIHNNYASYLAYIGDFLEAADHVRFSVGIDPSQEDKWLVLANLFQAADDYPGSEEVAREALRYFPSNPSFYVVEMLAQMRSDRWAEALVSVDSAITLTPADNLSQLSDFYTARGDMHLKLGSDSVAWTDYDTALLYNPDNALTLNNYAYSLAELGINLDRAIDMAQKSLLLDPDNINTIDTYAWALFMNKDYSRAREVFDSAIDRILSDEDMSAEAYSHAGDIYFMSGDPDRALDFWKKALSSNPADELLKRKVAHKTYFFK